MLGIDLNQYRNIPSYSQLAKDGYEFAIIKLATGVTFTNPLFEKQYNGCKNAGLILGVYTRADKTAGNGTAEAKYALNILGDRDVDLPIYYDIEGETLKASKETLTQMVLDFGKVMTEAGHRWGLYTSRSHFQYFDLDTIKAAGASIWCAAYNDVGPGMECDIWQRSSGGTITGYDGPVDIDVLHNEKIICKEEGKVSLNLIQCFQTQSGWYNGTTIGTPVGVCWHDTGAGNPTLKRYVQPSKNDSNYSYLLNLIGKNNNGNDWNRASANNAGLNAWIGKLADGSLATIQCGPWNYRPWGVGSGKYGSLNGDKNVANDKFWIQFEICDDYAHGQPCRKEYFEQAYQQAVEFTAYLCQLYNFDPFGTVEYRGKQIPTICCHQDSYKLGFGSNHGDVYLWFNRFGKTMDDVRKDVAKLMGKVVIENPPSPSQPSDPGQPLLQYGASGEAVRKAQNLLIKHGFSCGSSGADGQFGSNTKFAVIAFQKAKGLSADGVIGDKTWAALLAEPAQSDETPSSGEIKVGSIVSIKSGAKWYSGSAIPAWVSKINWIVYSMKGDRVVLNKSADGTRNGLMSPIHLSDIYLSGTAPSEDTGSSTTQPTTPSTPSTEVKVGSLVSIKSGSTWYSGSSIPSWVLKYNWYVYSLSGDRAVLNKSENGEQNGLMSPIKVSNLTVVGSSSSGSSSSTETSSAGSYKVKVMTDALNIRKGPGTNYDIAGVIRDRGIYTIVQTQGTWGKLKSGAGWISLGWCSRL